MKWFDNTPSIKFADFQNLSNSENWEYVDRIGEMFDEQSYTILKYLPTNKYYRTSWLMLDENGNPRPAGTYDPETDYQALVEVILTQVTRYVDKT